MMKYIFAILFFCTSAILTTNAQTYQETQQNLKLAQEYSRNGEYEKALVLFEQLFVSNKNNSYYYTQYLNTLLAMKEFGAAKELIEKQIKEDKRNPGYYVDLGNIYKQQDNEKKAKQFFDKAVKNIEGDEYKARKVASTFTKIDEYDSAIAIYKQVRKKTKKPNLFLYELATTYSKNADYENAIDYFLEYGKYYPNNLQIVKNYFQRSFKDESQFDLLQEKLYQKIQTTPNELLYPELLIWLFTNKKDFENAILQVKALDKRFKEDGNRVFKLGQDAIIENNYDAAADAFSYVVEKGKGKYYLPAKSELLRSKKLKIIRDPNYTTKDINILKKNFDSFVKETGKSSQIAGTLIDYAELFAIYLKDTKSAISLLEEVIEIPGLSKNSKATAKLSLGDYLLMQNEIWDAVLIYGQVDKAMKDDILGEEARFRNAKLSYFIGDFDWAQTQLSALKASTSELISNDAIDLSVFITDHLGLDTTTTTMEMYARADLLFMQNRPVRALKTLDSINTIYPGHGLEDDILLKRASIALKKKEFAKVKEYYEKIITDFPTEILADDATFYLGELYEYHLEKPEKAMEQYQNVIIDFAGSLHTVEARRRYRSLRGDIFN